MLRLITCQQATLLVEKQADTVLPFGDRSNLWLHLSYCAKCRHYTDQSALLSRLARGAASPAAAVALPDDVRERLRQLLL